MNLFFFSLPAKTHKDEPDEQSLTIHEPLHDTSEGSEFLDDAIRMVEQPLMYYDEESLAAGQE